MAATIYGYYHNTNCNVVEGIAKKDLQSTINRMSNNLNYTKLVVFTRTGSKAQVIELDRSMIVTDLEVLAGLCHGNTEIGYSFYPSGNVYCLDHAPEGMTADQISQGLQDGTVEGIIDEEWNLTETCRCCGRNLVEKERVAH